MFPLSVTPSTWQLIFVVKNNISMFNVIFLPFSTPLPRSKRSQEISTKPHRAKKDEYNEQQILVAVSYAISSTIF